MKLTQHAFFLTKLIVLPSIFVSTLGCKDTYVGVKWER